MARQNHGPLSRAKGKLGGVVYQQYEGMQIAREYQPVVKNPQTDPQTKNRARFKLSSQVIAQFKDVFMLRLTKLSNYTRIRRGAALRAIFEVTTGPSPESVNALVDAAVANINAKSVSGIAGPAITTVTGTHSVVAPNGATVIATTVDYDDAGFVIGIASEKYVSDGTAKVFTPTTDYKNSVIMTAYMIPTTEEGRASIGNAGFNADNDGWDAFITRLVAQGDADISNMTANVITAE